MKRPIRHGKKVGRPAEEDSLQPQAFDTYLRWALHFYVKMEAAPLKPWAEVQEQFRAQLLAEESLVGEDQG